MHGHDWHRRTSNRKGCCLLAFGCVKYLLPLDHVSKNQLSTNQNLFNAHKNSWNDCWTCILSLDIYWSKVLTDQRGLCRFFRKHKTVKNLKTATIKRVIIHLSNLQKKSLCNVFGQKMENTRPKYAPSVSQLLIIPCIGHSRSHFLPLIC